MWPPTSLDDDTSRRVRSSMIRSHNLNTEVEIIMFVSYVSGPTVKPFPLSKFGNRAPHLHITTSKNRHFSKIAPNCITLSSKCS